MDEREESEGQHTGDTPNTWNTSHASLGVEATAGATTSRAAVTRSEYSSSQWSDDGHERTDENGLTVGLYSSSVPGDYPDVSLAERRVEDSYHYCVLYFGSTSLLRLPCGPEALNEAPPLP